MKIEYRVAASEKPCLLQQIIVLNDSCLPGASFCVGLKLAVAESMK